MVAGDIQLSLSEMKKCKSLHRTSFRDTCSLFIKAWLRRSFPLTIIMSGEINPRHGREIVVLYNYGYRALTLTYFA